MKHILRIASLIFIVVCGTGCTTGYWVDRGRDAADVFTLTGGYGLGGKARVGPVGTGLGGYFDVSGLQGGDVFYEGIEDCDSGDLYLLLIGFEESHSSEISRLRDKDFNSLILLGMSIDSSGGFCTTKTDYSWHYLTQLEISAALGVGLKVGFNPGELLDFILGFCNVDLYNDDRNRNK